MEEKEQDPDRQDSEAQRPNNQLHLSIIRHWKEGLFSHNSCSTEREARLSQGPPSPQRAGGRGLHSEVEASRRTLDTKIEAQRNHSKQMTHHLLPLRARVKGLCFQKGSSGRTAILNRSWRVAASRDVCLFVPALQASDRERSGSLPVFF